jgi:magnesium-transporting ATPase (P-type)
MYLKYGVPEHTKSNNKIDRLPYNIIWVPFITIIKYFRSHENIYFLVLALFQLSTLGIFPREWSPTGPFSTAIPLAICIFVEIVTAIYKWYITWKQDKCENNKIFKFIDTHGIFYDIKNENIFPGYILYLVKNEISPVDGILIETITDNYTKINLALLTGESNIHHISKPGKNLNLNDYTGSQLIINENLDENDHTIGHIEFETTKISLTKSNIIVTGAINKSDGIYIWVTACGSDKKNKISKQNHKKYSRIDQFVGEYMMRVSALVLIFLIIVMSIVKTINSPNINSFVFLLFCVQNWILFNGIIPFSIKIFLILARSLEAHNSSQNFTTVNDSLQIDDFGKIKRIICDKTGTVTKNELDFTKLIVAGSNDIIDVATFSTNAQSIPNKFYECLGLCVHQTEDDFSTIEDKIIRAGYQSLGAQCIENNDEIILKFNNCTNIYEYININGLDFTFDRKMSSKIVKTKSGKYLIYCKGSLDTIYQKISPQQQEKLRTVEKIVCHKYPDLRLLAFAYKKIVNTDLDNFSNGTIFNLLESDLMFLGIIGIKDILQPEVSATVKNLESYGISCSLCTGDRKITAIAVADEVDIVHNKGELLDYDVSINHLSITDKTLIFSGEQTKLLQNLQHFKKCLTNCRNFICYNMTPDNKKIITNILENANINTLTIGDGFNDLGMFDSSSISVAIRGNNFVENYTDFSVKQFSGLNKLFDLSIESYNKNTKLINFTFYRCSTVIFVISAHYLMNFHENYQSPFNGFVLQGFNFAWTICALFYLITHKTNFANKVNDFNILKKMEHSSYKFTSIWNLEGVFNGIFIVYLCNLYELQFTKNFNDILALLIIVIINTKFFEINGIGLKTVISFFVGIINFIIYLHYMQTLDGVFNNMVQLPCSFYLYLMVCVI